MSDLAPGFDQLLVEAKPVPLRESQQRTTSPIPYWTLVYTRKGDTVRIFRALRDVEAGSRLPSHSSRLNTREGNFGRVPTTNGIREGIYSYYSTEYESGFAPGTKVYAIDESGRWRFFVARIAIPARDLRYKPTNRGTSQYWEERTSQTDEAEIRASVVLLHEKQYMY